MIEITATETHEQGVKGYLVEDFKMLSKTRLPLEYCFSGDAVQNYHDDYIATAPSWSCLLRKNTFVKEDEFVEAIKYIRKCGTRLQKIKDRIKEEQKTWNRTITIKI